MGETIIESPVWTELSDIPSEGAAQESQPVHPTHKEREQQMLRGNVNLALSYGVIDEEEAIRLRNLPAAELAIQSRKPYLEALKVQQSKLGISQEVNKELGKLEELSPDDKTAHRKIKETASNFYPHSVKDDIIE